jgi:uncharacterized protein YebE (UPF0316 family)
MLESITAFLSGQSPWIYMFIFFGKLFEVTLASLRSQLIHKGERVSGAFIALFEYTFWLCVTASAISGFSGDIAKIILLVCAFACGNVLGSVLEGKIALGYCTLNSVFTNREKALRAADILRQKGFGLTILTAEGINDAKRTVLLITTKRKDVPIIKAVLNHEDSEVVIAVLLTQKQEGGMIANLKK